MELHNWIVSLHNNEVQLLSAAITGFITLVAAVIAVQTAFNQIVKQFENKVIYEGWTDFQSKLFNFSTALSNYDSTIQWLKYIVKSQNNPLVNGGNLSKYRSDKWNDVVGSYAELQKAYVEFLRSYETHEIIFISLKKMHKAFIEEYRKRVDDKQMGIMEKIFPEMYGKSNVNEKEQLRVIDDYWMDASEISAFLDDFRRELQNITVGKILNKKVPRRIPHEEKYKILTVKGFVSHNSVWRKLKKKLGKHAG